MLDTYLRDVASDAVDDEGTVVRLDDHVQIHDDALVLVAVARPTHLLQPKSAMDKYRIRRSRCCCRLLRIRCFIGDVFSLMCVILSVNSVVLCLKTYCN